MAKAAPAHFISTIIFSGNAEVSAAFGSAPRKVLPTLRSRAMLGTLRIPASSNEAALRDLLCNHPRTRLLFATGSRPHASRKQYSANLGWTADNRSRASHAGASLTVT